jgi:uncharacterized protein (TIGR00369 family)
MSAKMILDPNPANGCFGCGGANESGMRLTFALDTEERRASGKFVLGKRYAGGAGFAHGGVIAILLDEAMGKISKLTDERAVTAELHIEYKQPVPVDSEILVEGWQVNAEGRNRFRMAEIRDMRGNLLARGNGRFVDLTRPAIGQPSQA